jgi:hypothetical protein
MSDTWMPVVVGFLLQCGLSFALAAGRYGATLSPAPPPGAVRVPARDGALAEAVRAHGEGVTFYLERGVHRANGEIRPRLGSVFLGAPGAVLDGGNATARCFVHDPGLIPYSASSPRYSVTLRNLTIRNYAPAKQDCAVNAADTGQGWSRVLEDRGDRNGWLLDHCTLERNRAGGALLGSASTARGCLAVENGQQGFKATGRGVRFLACRSTGNNRERAFNYFEEAGGMKCWNVKDLLVDGGEYDHNGGPGLWLDYAWDGNVIRGVAFHDNLRPGVCLEMTIGAEVTGCRFERDDLDGIAGEIPAAFRPWDRSPKSGADLWSGEIYLFDACGSGIWRSAEGRAVQFAGKTWIHGNTMRRGNGGVVCLYQGRGGIDPLGKQMAGSQNGPAAGLAGIVVEGNSIHCSAGYSAGVNVLANRDYKDAAGSWGPIAEEEAAAQFRAPVFRNNRYSGVLRFSVPAAALKAGGGVWEWNRRATTDLAGWRSLGKG